MDGGGEGEGKAAQRCNEQVAKGARTGSAIVAFREHFHGCHGRYGDLHSDV